MPGFDSNFHSRLAAQYHSSAYRALHSVDSEQQSVLAKRKAITFFEKIFFFGVRLVLGIFFLLEQQTKIEAPVSMIAITITLNFRIENCLQ